LTALEAAVAALVEPGAMVTELTTPFDNLESVWSVNNGSDRRAQFGHHLERHRATMCPTFVRQMDRVASHSTELHEAIFARTRLYRQVQAWLETADIVAMPTLSRPTLPIDQNFLRPDRD
jgi:aspartyl-tRNA(Asn)/glutamyl-tRNA(Gln) amidotransferase subunit A